MCTIRRSFNKLCAEEGEAGNEAKFKPLFILPIPINTLQIRAYEAVGIALAASLSESKHTATLDVHRG